MWVWVGMDVKGLEFVKGPGTDLENLGWVWNVCDGYRGPWSG